MKGKAYHHGEAPMRTLIAAALLLALVGSTSAAVPSGPPRILVIGDAIASGAYATGPQATYPALLANALDQPALLAQPATTLVDAEAAWARAEGGVWDVVVLQFGADEQPTDEWQRRYAALVTAILADRAAVGGGGGRVVCATPFNGGSAERGNVAEAIRTIPGCRIADVYTATSGRADLRLARGGLTFYGRGEAPDAAHPNDPGHALIAEVILEAIAWPTFTHLPVIR
jgi:hypothetical protein